MPRHEYLYGQTLPQLEALCNRLEMPRFAAKQIARWLYDKHATTIEAMSDLSARHRALLAETYEVGLTAPEKVSISTDGTKKYLYRTSQNHFIESAYIPDGDRATLCISSQAGCRMGCRFCASTQAGRVRDLEAGEICSEIYTAQKDIGERISHIELICIGEPQDIVAEVQKITNGHGCTVAFDSACFPGSLTMIMQPGIVCNAGRVVPMGFCTVPEKITQQMINGRELTICGTRMSLNQWVPTAQKMAEGKYHMEGLATTFVKFSEIEKVFDNIVHPDPAVKKTVILFDGAED